jgi:hypothetical protein
VLPFRSTHRGRISIPGGRRLRARQVDAGHGQGHSHGQSYRECRLRGHGAQCGAESRRRSYRGRRPFPRRHLSPDGVLRPFPNVRFDPIPKETSCHLGRQGQGQGWGGSAGRRGEQSGPLISMRWLSPPPVSHAAVGIPGASPRARAHTLISLQMEASGSACNKRQKLRSGASIRAFSPLTRGWIQLPGAL